MRKKPFKGILLICDMDGTLLNSSHRVSDENKAAIARFVEGGGLFTVATGRMEKMVEPYLADLPVNVPSIVYNGAAIYDFEAGEMLWQCFLPDSAKEIAEGIYTRFPEAGLQLYYNSRIHIVRESRQTQAHKQREGFVPVYCTIDDVPLPWLKILTAWDPEKLLGVEEYLKGFKEYHYVYSEPQFIELLHKDASKGRALRELKTMPGFNIDCVVAMGDNMNDVEMLKEATVGVAVGNASDHVKGFADMCCCSNDSHAVSEVIGWIEEGKIGNLS